MKKIILLIAVLVISFDSYAQVNSDTTSSKKMSDKKHQIKEVIIRKRNNGNSINHMDALRVEKLNETELKKNACCTLAESFESNTSVEIGSTNALSGAKQIEMLGLQGTYVQTLTELLPNVRGLNYTYGFNNIPGPFVKSIYINKGPGSVTNSFESMTGQIDIEYHKPEEYKPLLYINGYTNTVGRSEINVMNARQMTDKISTMLFLHYNHSMKKVDANVDGFLDFPLQNMLHAMNRWKYNGKKMESVFLVSYHQANRNAGQMQYDFTKNDAEQNTIYGVKDDDNKWNFMHKIGYSFNEEHSHSIGLQTAYVIHDRKAFYGKNHYDADQKSFYTNLIYQRELFNHNHELRLGGGLQHDKIEEQFAQTALFRNEIISGVFAEHTYKPSHKFSLMGGMRLDYNNWFKKWYFIPRINTRYLIGTDFTVRASAGSGFRTPTLFAENTRFMASNRAVQILGTIKPEYSWNYGMNLSYDFFEKNGRLSLDIYRTNFVNQLIADYDYHPQQIVFYNIEGKSNAWYVQAEWYYQLIKNLDIRLAYKFNDVRATQLQGEKLRVFNPKHRALFNIAYQTNNNKWAFDFTSQFVGAQRLPDYSKNPEAYRPNVGNYAPSYFRFLGQVSYKMKNLDLYIGSENIGNFTQQQQIIDASNPFGNYFDAGNIWGPTMGRIVYGGFRYTVKNPSYKPLLSKAKIIKEEIKVSGNCGMCKETIETALKVDGIKEADWDSDTKILWVVYDELKINNDAIQQRIAAVGYDTPKYKGSDKAYENLPGCCRYRD